MRNAVEKDLPLVVLVDDSETDLSLNVLSLKNVGLAVAYQTFTDGEEALRFLIQQVQQNSPPVLAIFDLSMPEISGIEMLEILDEGGYKQFPVVILSGSRRAEDTARIFQLGADGCFEKPINLYKSYELFQNIADRFMKAHPILSTK